MQIYMQSKDVRTLIIIISLFPIKVFIKSKLKKNGGRNLTRGRNYYIVATPRGGYNTTYLKEGKEATMGGLHFYTVKL